MRVQVAWHVARMVMMLARNLRGRVVAVPMRVQVAWHMARMVVMWTRLLVCHHPTPV